MERNPLFLGDKEYAAKRLEIVSGFNQKEAAVFSLLENMVDLTTAPGDLKHKFTWSYGRDAEEFLNIILSSKRPTIPLPGFYDYIHRYQRFNWKILDKSGKKVAFFGVRMEFADFGIVLSEKAKESSFSQVQNDLDKLYGQIPYPIVATDKTGYRHENQALRLLKTA